MKTGLLSLFAGVAMLGGVGLAQADEVLLTEAQMDVVTAGYNSWSGYSSGDASFTGTHSGDTLPYVYSYTDQQTTQTCYSGTCGSGNHVYASTNPSS